MEDLHAASLYAFSDYVIPLQPSLAQFETLLNNRSFDADASMVAWNGGGNRGILERRCPSFKGISDYQRYAGCASWKRARRPTWGSVTSFETFIVSIPDGIDASAYNTVIIWCEAFGRFSTAAQYQQ